MGRKREKCEVLSYPFSLKDSFVEESDVLNVTGKEIHVVFRVMLRPEFVRNRDISSLFQGLGKLQCSTLLSLSTIEKRRNGIKLEPY